MDDKHRFNFLNKTSEDNYSISEDYNEKFNFDIESIKFDETYPYNTIDYNTVAMNLNRILLHPIYQSVWTIKARYKFIFGSKDNGKSKVGALRTVTKFLAHPYRNAVVMRMYAAWNTLSTFPDILWSFDLLARTFNQPMLKTISAEEKRRGKVGRFVYTKTSPHTITDTETGSKIIFTGRDRIAKGGFSLDNPDHAYDLIWYDEPVDIDPGEDDLMDDSSIVKWKLIESTIFRGTRIINKDTGISAMKKGFEWVDYEVIQTFNSHNPEAWQLKEIGDYYVPLNPIDKDDIGRMERIGFKAYYDETYQNGEGLFVMRTSAYLNPMRDQNFIEQIKKDNFELYAYLYCGATQQIGGMAYSGYINNLIHSPVDTKEIWPLSIGIDYAHSPDHGDYFVAEFLGTSIKRDGALGTEEPRFDKLIYYDEFAWSNKDFSFKDDHAFAKSVLEKLFYYLEKHENWRAKIAGNGLAVSIDTQAASFMTTMAQTIEGLKVTNPNEIWWLSKIAIIPVEGKNSKVELEDGGKVDARFGRVNRNRRFLTYSMVHIDKQKCPMFYNQYRMTGIKNNGQVIDKYRDAVDAGDYAYMVSPIINNFDRYQIMLAKVANKELKELL